MYLSRKLEKNFGIEMSKIITKYTKTDNNEVKFDASSMTRNENAIDILFSKWYEIEQTFSYLSYCRIYMNSFKYYPKIPKVTHLHFIYESYLNYIYVFKLRIEDYIKAIQRVLKKYKSDDIIANNIQKMNNLAKIYKDYFKGYITIRGQDVHTKKYFPYDIHEVSGHENIIESDLNTPRFKNFLKTELSDLKKKYREILLSNEESIKKIMKLYFNCVNEILFKEKYIQKVISNGNHIDGKR